MTTNPADTNGAERAERIRTLAEQMAADFASNPGNVAQINNLVRIHCARLGQHPDEWQLARATGDVVRSMTAECAAATIDRIDNFTMAEAESW